MNEPVDFNDAEPAIGGWTCPCGILRVSNVRGQDMPSMLFMCPSCGEAAEIMAVEQ